MSKKLLTLIFGILLGYVAVHWYVVVRLSQLLSPVAKLAGPSLKMLIPLIGLAYPAGRLANWRLPGNLGDRLIVIGCYWLGILLYCSLLLLALDALALFDKLFHFLPAYLNPGRPEAGWLVISLSIAANAFGALNARRVKINRVSLTIDKYCQVNPLTIVCVSDLHLGLLVGLDRLKQLTAMIQQLQPDLILFPGDILDETVSVFANCRMAEELRRLSPRFGMYACLGSHEYIWGGAEKAIHHLTRQISKY